MIPPERVCASSEVSPAAAVASITPRNSQALYASGVITSLVGSMVAFRLKFASCVRIYNIGGRVNIKSAVDQNGCVRVAGQTAAAHIRRGKNAVGGKQ